VAIATGQFRASASATGRAGYLAGPAGAPLGDLLVGPATGAELVAVLASAMNLHAFSTCSPSGVHWPALTYYGMLCQGLQLGRMRLFISWSGGRSHRLAVVLKKWLETHFKGDGISAFVSSEIPKGSLWQPAVNAELQRADAGLVCLTAQSLDSDWVLFEAGALSTAVALNAGEARIFTYLLGVDPADQISGRCPFDLR
jgi:hypothetical protein